MIDLEKAMTDPQSVFKVPHNVVVSKELPMENKIAILRQWEYDARTLEVAEEENMRGNSQHFLSAVLQALDELGVKHDSQHTAPTKQGGSDN